MADWQTFLNQLEISDGAVTGLSASDKPVQRGKLLQLPAADRPLFFVVQPLEVLKTLRNSYLMCHQVRLSLTLFPMPNLFLTRFASRWLVDGLQVQCNSLW